jgi:RNA polymerase sigma factor (sigma-70 family)
VGPALAEIRENFRKSWNRYPLTSHYESGRIQETNQMAGGLTGAGFRNRLGTLFKFGVVGDLPDRQLVEQFLTARDGADEVAFAALVERHGPMVLGVCRQVLDKSHDADDAFQAAFLILARKAGSVRNTDSLASWLHGVALRVALRVKADNARRRAHERRCAMMKVVCAGPDENRSESWPELHQEIARLPAHYRQPVILCYLEGLTTEEAALRIGCPKGTVMSRLSRARERLRRRLDRRDLAVPAPLLAAGQTSHATVALPAVLLDSTVCASLEFAGRRAAEAALASATVTALARGVLYTMTISKLKILGAAALACALALGGARSFGQLGRRVEKEPAAPVADASDSQAALTHSVDKLEAELHATARRNAEMQREVRGIKNRLEALRAAAQLTADPAPVKQLAAALSPEAPAVVRLADVLKRHPPKRGSMDGDRMQVYMMDLVDGGTTLIADEPRPGLVRCSDPRWSNDGSRIVFGAAVDRQFRLSRLMSIDVREGDASPTLTDFGPGCLPTFSSDDKKIAFLLTAGAVQGAQEGVWIMEADGSGRRRAGDFGAPLFSRGGREFLINDFSDAITRTVVMNIEKLTDGILAVEGYQIFSWPTWAGPATLVACLATQQEGDTIALLDVTKPAEAKIIEVLWKRGPDLDLTPRWPLYLPETGRCFFFGVDPTNKRTLYCVKRGDSGRAKGMEPDGQDDWRGGLTAGIFSSTPTGPPWASRRSVRLSSSG